MKLNTKIFSRIAALFILILGIWSVVFYFVIINEFTDETDDYLENFAKRIILLHNSGIEITANSSDNNSYILREITAKEMEKIPPSQFSTEMIYIADKMETEPARTLKTAFRDTRDKFYELKISIPTVEGHDLRESIFHWLLALVFMLLLVLLVVNFWVFRREMQPLYTLLNWLKLYKIGKNQSLPATKTTTAEFSELYLTMSKSMEKNEQIFEQQKQFISNASHEMQTPLAVCQNRVEMLLESETMTESELAELLKIRQTLNSISKMNKTLLFISKIENRQFLQTEIIDFNVLIKKIINDFKTAYAHKHLDVQIYIQGIFEVEINETLAHSLINNLIKNAFIHSNENSKIYIKISDNYLIISNSGILEPLDQEQIFKRFYQAQYKKSGSTGLGLSIIKTICDNSGLKISYEYDNSEHRFMIAK
jgi:signal transduction histidine kinase